MSVSNDPPAQWPAATERKPYQPMPGDLCELKAGGPKWIYGSRLVRVMAEVRGHGHADEWYVRSSGETEDWQVEERHLELIWRRPVP